MYLGIIGIGKLAVGSYDAESMISDEKLHLDIILISYS